ncbi:LysR family transcriptional regulator [Oscillibacter sp. MSJ-2]|uniref:LysR family transcriptional regulator n=1 Tax=Dysosmobacter acutus TaxID=2841504 RepID=A0ABS6F837_9FIRM|nr:selenium metabolism-associated LysR family transcriptional regulator [Dysosmobacter acutus]MBU5626218.1 LysR family transcriptional regulator [Dysosmobacter acutus]
MDIKQLEVFAAVVDSNSFSKAAEQLHLTQPTVSTHIASLEKELKIKLIVRTTKEIFPSEAGKLLYQYARRMLKLRREALEAIQSYSKEMCGTIHIAASTIPGQYFLPRLMRGFREEYPDIQFAMEITDSQEVAAAVSSRGAEIGFCGTMLDTPKCTFQEFADDRLVLITPNTRKYRQYQKKGFPVRRILEESFISRESGSGTRKETEQFLREMGVDVARMKIAVEVRSTDDIKKMVSEGLGIAVISKTASESDCQFGNLLAFDFDSVSLRRKLYAVRHKKGILSPIAQTFYEYALEYYKKGNPGDGSARA